MLNGSTFPCNSSAVLDGDETTVVMFVDMNQAVLTEFLLAQAAPEGEPERYAIMMILMKPHQTKLISRLPMTMQVGVFAA